MAQDIAVAEMTRVREPPRSEKIEASETEPDSGGSTKVEPVEQSGGSETEDSTEYRDASAGSGSSTSDIDGRGNKVDFMV